MIVSVGVPVGVGEIVGVGVSVGVGVTVGLGVSVGVKVAVDVRVTVAVGDVVGVGSVVVVRVALDVAEGEGVDALTMAVAAGEVASPHPPSVLIITKAPARSPRQRSSSTMPWFLVSTLPNSSSPILAFSPQLRDAGYPDLCPSLL